MTHEQHLVPWNDLPRGVTTLDLHLHNEYSIDSTAKLSDMLRVAKHRQLAGMSLTNHDTTKRLREVEKDVTREGLLFLRGIEVTTMLLTKSGAHFPHFIVLNFAIEAMKDFLGPRVGRWPYGKPPSIKSFMRDFVAHHPECFVIVAHPLPDSSDRRLTRFVQPQFNEVMTSLTFSQVERLVQKYPGSIHGIEVLNKRPRHRTYHEAVLRLMETNKLIGTAGSDAHQAELVGMAGVWLREHYSTSDQVMQALRTQPVGTFFR